MILIEDDGTRYASYEANSGLPQTRKYINLKDYSASALYAGSMFAGNVQFRDDKSDYDEDMTSRLIVRSLPGRLSVFDYVNEFAILPFTAKALAVFAYKLYAFGSEGYAVINPSTFQVELTSEKVFCDNPDFVCSVEEGLFVFCNGKLFVIDGFNTTDISLPISRSSDRRFIGLDDIDVSKLFYHSNTESIMVMGTINKKESIINEEYQPDPITVASENLLIVYMQDIKSIDSVNNESNDKTLPPISLCTNWGNEAYLEEMHPFFNNGDIVMFALSLKTKQWRLIKPFENSEGNKLSPLFLDNKNYFIYYNAEQSHCYDLFQDKTPAKSEDTINRLKSLYISRKIYITSEAISAFLYSIKFNFERIYTNTTLKVLFFKENRKVKEVSLATGDKYYDRFIELNTWLLEDHEKTSLNDRKFNYIIIEIEGKFENISSILTIARGLVK
jgi:hypothetical protein